MSTETWGEILSTAEYAEQLQEPAPAGTYILQVVSADAKVASTGKPMISARLRIASGEHAGKTVFVNLVVSPDNPTALAMFFQSMEALGVEKDFFLARKDQPVTATLAEVAKAIEGRLVKANLVVGAYQGRAKNEIRGVLLPVTEAEVAEVATAQPATPTTAPTPEVPF